MLQGHRENYKTMPTSLTTASPVTHFKQILSKLNKIQDSQSLSVNIQTIQTFTQAVVKPCRNCVLSMMVRFPLGGAWWVGGCGRWPLALCLPQRLEDWMVQTLICQISFSRVKQQQILLGKDMHSFFP